MNLVKRKMSTMNCLGALECIANVVCVYIELDLEEEVVAAQFGK